MAASLDPVAIHAASALYHDVFPEEVKSQLSGKQSALLLCTELTLGDLILLD
jgi:hypothetical protein